MFQFPFLTFPLLSSPTPSSKQCAHIIYLLSQLFATLLASQMYRNRGKRVALQGCHHRTTRKVFAWRTFVWHFTLATCLEHFTFNTSCIVLPSGGSALAASVSVRAAFPSIPACHCMRVCLFAFVKGKERKRVRVFHEFSLSFAAKYSLLIPARGRQSSVARVCFSELWSIKRLHRQASSWVTFAVVTWRIVP